MPQRLWRSPRAAPRRFLPLEAMSQGVYRSRGQADTSNSSDNVYGQSGSRALLAMKRNGSAISSGYMGSLVIGVDPS